MTFDELADLGDDIEKINKEFSLLTHKEQLEAIGMTEEEYQIFNNKILNQIESYIFLAEVEKLLGE